MVCVVTPPPKDSGRASTIIQFKICVILSTGILVEGVDGAKLFIIVVIDLVIPRSLFPVDFQSNNLRLRPSRSRRQAHDSFYALFCVRTALIVLPTPNRKAKPVLFAALSSGIV